MKKTKKQLLTEIKELIKQSHLQFEINEDQTDQRVLFDTLVAIDESSKLLQNAWEIGESNDLADQALRADFVDTFTDFAKIKKDLNKDLKYKQ